MATIRELRHGLPQRSCATCGHEYPATGSCAKCRCDAERGTGRTTRMLECVAPGDYVIIACDRSARLRDRSHEHLHFVSVRSAVLGALDGTTGLIHVDHFALETMSHRDYMTLRDKFGDRMVDHR